MATDMKFVVRYKIACFVLANDLFNTLRADTEKFNFSIFDSLQRDKGFYITTLRLIEQATNFQNNEDFDTIKERMKEGSAIFFKTSVLDEFTKTMESINNSTYKCESPDKVTNIFDIVVMDDINKSNFTFGAPQAAGTLEFLDVGFSGNAAGKYISAAELGIFSQDALDRCRKVLDFSSSTGFNAELRHLETIEYLAPYKNFFALAKKLNASN